MKTYRSLDGLSADEIRIEYEALRRGVNRERFITHGAYLVIIVILLICFKCCTSNTEQKYNEQLQGKDELLKAKDESIGLLNKTVQGLENRKAVLIVKDTTVDKKHGRYVMAIIDCTDGTRPSAAFFADIKVPYKVPVPIPCPKCPEVNKDRVALPVLPIIPGSDNNESIKSSKVNMEQAKPPLLTNDWSGDSIKVSLNKQYRQDTIKTLFEKNISLKTFLLSSPLPSIDFTHQYTEYLPNEYRAKSERTFWYGVGFAGLSGLLYGASELVGHPQYFDDRDNSGAQDKHNLIMGLRAASGLSGAASLFNFGRSIHYHHMEGKFIVYPTSIGLNIKLNTNKK